MRELIAVACMTLLQSCAQTSAIMSRDTVHSTAFDGDWNAVMTNTATRQTFSNLQFDCDEFTEPFFLRVRQGVVSGFLETDENFSFRTRLDSQGVFNALIPIESYYRYRANAQVEKSTIALLLSGNLSADVLRGRFVIGDTRMNLNGCSTDVDYVAL